MLVIQLLPRSARLYEVRLYSGFSLRTLPCDAFMHLNEVDAACGIVVGEIRNN